MKNQRKKEKRLSTDISSETILRSEFNQQKIKYRSLKLRGCYVLDKEKNVVEAASFEEAILFQTKMNSDHPGRMDYQVLKSSEAETPIEISTVFLSINHNPAISGMPILFETMIFGPPSILDSQKEYQWRHSTYKNAKFFHHFLVCLLRVGLDVSFTDELDYIDPSSRFMQFIEETSHLDEFEKRRLAVHVQRISSEEGNDLSFLDEVHLSSFATINKISRERSGRLINDFEIL